MVAAAVGFVLLTAGVWARLPIVVDNDATVSLAVRYPALFDAAQLVTHAGDPPVLAALCLVVVVALMRWRRWDEARFVVGAVAAGALFRWGVLPIIARVRPDTPYAEHLGWAYPSGHALYSITAALVLLFIALPLQRTRLETMALCGLVLLWPATVGVSRAVLGAHWAGDVLGGWLLGATAVGMIAACCRSQLTKLTPSGHRAKTVRRQLHSSVGGEVRSKSGADPQR